LPWTWDPKKNRVNIAKHKLNFETAQLVFDDPGAASRLDPYPDEERWQTIGRIGEITIIVIHTAPQTDPEEEDGRIISARRAKDHERKAYEEGDWN
jgi:uncharacterized protein